MIDAKTLERAIEFAMLSHKGQFRKGDGRPYIMHPISVMTKLTEIKQSSNAYMLAAAAVLHDTVEDCGVELDTIAKNFGYYIAALVEELTLDKSKYETIGKTKYLCQEMVKMSSYALCIKLCDRLDNIQDMKYMPDDFVKRYTEETIAIVVAISTQRKNITPTHRELLRQITQLIPQADTDI